MKHLLTILCLLAIQNIAKADMDPVYILKADMVCTNGKTISGYFSDYEFQGMVTTLCEGDQTRTKTLTTSALDSLLQVLKAVDRSNNESFFGFTLYAKAFTKDMFADTAYLGRYCFLLGDNSDSIKWMDIKSVLNIRFEGAGMAEPDPSVQPIHFQLDYTSTPIVPKALFEIIENQKVVNYFIYSCGDENSYGEALMLINYDPSITVQQLEEWAKKLSQNPTGCPDEAFNVLFPQKVVTISMVNGC
jgi:hypothetical protein